MKGLLMLGVVGIALGFGVSSFAADNETVELYAVSELTTQNSNALQGMSDQELKSVEGMSYTRHHDCGCGYSSRSVQISQSNWLDQANLNIGGHRNGSINQMNDATQSNVARVR
ncbi:hypothetical protein [Nitrospira sp. Nam80]|jgi:hypothetical protein